MLYMLILKSYVSVLCSGGRSGLFRGQFTTAQVGEDEAPQASMGVGGVPSPPGEGPHFLAFWRRERVPCLCQIV